MAKKKLKIKMPTRRSEATHTETRNQRHFLSALLSSNKCCYPEEPVRGCTIKGYNFSFL